MSNNTDITLELDNDKSSIKQDLLLDQLASELIAFVGAQVIKKHLPQTRDDFEVRQKENGRTLGLLILDSFDPNYLKLICDELLRQMHSKGLDNSSQDYKQDDTFDPLACLYMRIDAAHLKSAQGYDEQSSYIDHQSNAAYWRNHCTEISHKMILCSTSDNNASDTIGNITKINQDHLSQALPETFEAFVHERHQELAQKYDYHLSNLDNCEPIKAVLSFIQKSDNFANSLAILARYCVATWSHYSKQASINSSLGMALNELNLPRYALIFDHGKKKKMSLKNYQDALHRYQQDISSNILQLTNVKTQLTKERKETLSENYQKYYSADSGDNSIVLAPWERALIKSYLLSIGTDNYDSSFNNLCTIDWDKLQPLFLDIKTPKKTESLFESTKRLFEEYQENESDFLSSEQLDHIESLLKGSAASLSQAQKDELYEILHQHVHIFNQGPKVKREWEKRIFSKQSFNDRDFILALTKAMINIMSSSGDEGAALKSVTLKLQGSLKNLQATNYNVGCYFSLRFGVFLRQLFDALNSNGQERLIVVCPKDKQDQNINVLFNFAKFFEEQQEKNADLKKSRLVKKDATSYKFYLEPTFVDGEVGERCIIEWQFDVKELGLNLLDDLNSLVKSKSLCSGVFNLNAFSVQGGIQALNLKDTDTFLKVNKIKHGAFFATNPEQVNNLDSCFVKIYTQLYTQLEELFNNNDDDDDITQEKAQCYLIELEQIKDAYYAFKQAYCELLQDYSNCVLEYPKVCLMHDKFSLVLYLIMKSSFAQEQSNEEIIQKLSLALVECINSTGMAYLEQYRPRFAACLTNASSQDQKSLSNITKNSYAIATPLAPQSLHNFSLRHERMVRFIKDIFDNKLSLQDRDALKESLSAEMELCEGAETIFSSKIKYDKNKSKDDKDVLLNSQSVNGYTLYDSLESLRQSYALSNAKGKTSSKAQTSFKSKVYETAAIKFIEQHITSRPYLHEQCTIMIYYCGIASLPLAIYKQLLESKKLSSTKFNLVVVNCSVNECSQIYKSFEDERIFSNTNSIQGSHYQQRIRVSVLADSGDNSECFNSQIVNSSNGVFNRYRGNVSLVSKSKQQMDLIAWSQIADICLMFHVFDSQAKYEFVKNNNALLQEDELKNLHSMVSYSDLAKGSASSIGKFMVSPELGINEIIEQHALYYLAKKDLSVFKENQNELSSICNRANMDLASYTWSLAQPKSSATKVVVPVLELKTEEDSYFCEQLIDNVQKYADVVVYFDELMCRSLLANRNLKIIYHEKLKNSALNLIIASKETSASAGHFVFDLLNSLEITDSNLQQQIYSSILDDAAALSGRIIMQAQMRRNSAHEMMGLVLCKHLATQALKEMMDSLSGKALLVEPCFIPIDDYASYLGYNSGNRADLLAIQVFKLNQENKESLSDSQTVALDNKYVMVLYIIESKFFTNKDSKALKDSLAQTRNSIDNLYNALKLIPGKQSIDRSLLLSNIAHLMQFVSWNLRNKKKIAKVQQLIAKEQVSVVLKGSSWCYAVDSAQLTKSLKVGVNVKMEPTIAKQKHSSIPITQITITNTALKELIEQVYTNSTPDNNALTSLLSKDQDNLLSKYLTISPQDIICNKEP